MPAHLTQPEWKLLHQAMDQVDSQRRTAQPVDLARVKEVAMATYRAQGIEVEEALVDQALASLGQAAGTSRSPRTLTLDLAALEQAEQAGLARERARQAEARQARLSRDPVARMLAAQEAKEARYQAHQPASDAQLHARLAHHLAHHAARLRLAQRLSRASWAVLAIGLVAGAVGGMGGIGGLEMSGLNAFSLMISGIGVGAFGTKSALGLRTHWQDHSVKAMALVRGQEALAAGSYAATELSRALAITGTIVVESLELLDADSRDRARHQLQRMVDRHGPLMLDVWKGWEARGLPLRANDLAVLVAWARERERHPFRAGGNLSKLIDQQRMDRKAKDLAKAEAQVRLTYRMTTTTTRTSGRP